MGEDQELKSTDGLLKNEDYLAIKVINDKVSNRTSNISKRSMQMVDSGGVIIDRSLAPFMSPNMEHSLTSPAETVKNRLHNYGFISLWKISSLKEKLELLGALLTSVILGLFVPLMPYLYGKVQTAYERNVAGSTNLDEFRQEITEIAFTFFYIGGLIFVCYFISSLLWSRLSLTIYSKVLSILFEALIDKQVSWFESNSSLDTENYLDSLISEAKDIQKFIYKIGLAFTRAVSALLASIIISLIINYKLGLVAFISVFMVICFIIFVKLKISLSFSKVALEKGKIAEYLSDLFENISLFHWYDTLNYESEKFTKMYIKRIEAHKTIYRNFALFLGVANFLLTSTFALIFWYGGYLFSNDNISSGAILQIFVVSTVAFNNLLEIAGHFPNIGQTLASINSIFSTIGIEKDNSSISEPTHSLENFDIIFNNVSFSYQAEGKNVLKNLNFKIQKGSIVGITGRSGSGKSTVVQLLLKFYLPSAGTILFNDVDYQRYNESDFRRDVAFVSQEPFLFSCTILENLVFGGKHSIETVDAACKAACIYKFINGLPLKYNTAVGDGLISGGQKQRILIARAILRSPKVLILDEATSFLDLQTETKVSKNLKEILVSTTIIVIAHRIECLKNCNQIFVFDSGEIKESGQFDCLVQRNGIFTALINSSAVLLPKVESKKGKSLDGFKKSVDKSRISIISQRQSFSQGQTISLELSSIRQIWKAVKHKTFNVYLILLFSIFCGISFPLTSFIVSTIVKNYTYGLNDPRKIMLNSVLLCLCLALYKGFCYCIRFWLANDCALFLQKDLRLLVINNIIKRDFSWFEEFNSKEALVQTINDDPSSFQLMLSTCLSDFTELISILLSSAAISIYFGWKLTFLIYSAIPIILCVCWFVIRRISKLESDLMEIEENLYETAMQYLDAIRTVVSLNLQHFATKKFKQCVYNIKNQKTQNLWICLQGALLQALYVIFEGYVVFTSGYFYYKHEFSYFQVLIILTCTVLCSTGIMQNVKSFSDFAMVQSSAKRLSAFVHSNHVKKQLMVENAANDIHGSIEFHQVSFSYPTRPEKQILKTFNFKVNAGEKIGITGDTGCGKSSIFNLLRRKYKPTSGSIYVDGVNIKKYQMKRFCKSICHIPQMPQFFQRSIRENICYGYNSTKDDDIKLIEAAKFAGIYDLINTLPEKFDTIIGDNYHRLSGGQKQLLALARAFYGDYKIFLLDEFTASLDNEKQAFVVERVNNATIGKTVIIIAHRLESLAFVDKKFKLEQGVLKPIL